MGKQGFTEGKNVSFDICAKVRQSGIQCNREKELIFTYLKPSLTMRLVP